MNPAIRRALRLLALKISQPSPCRNRCSTVSKYRLIRCRRSRSWIGACSMRDSRSVIRDSPFARRLERTGTGRPYGNRLDTIRSGSLKMQAGLDDPDFHVSLPGGGEFDRPAKLAKSSLSVDRHGDADRSWTYDFRASPFRFYGIDRNL